MLSMDMDPLPHAHELMLAPDEETPEVARLHGAALDALKAQDLPTAQRYTADLIDWLDQQEHREPGAKTRRLIDFVVLLS